VIGSFAEEVEIMPAYLLGGLEVRDTSWVERYRATVPSLVAKHGGKYLARGGAMEKLEGGSPLPTTFVILEFPTLDEARAFYRDPEYAPFIRLRQSGSNAELLLVDGI
jgi:uncharacterized protein (DUF1330 family)